MPKCSRCQTTVSVWSFDLASALCPNCKEAAAREAALEAQKAADAQRLEQVKRTIEPRAAPEAEPVSGPTLIVISLVIAAVGGFVTASPDARIAGLIIVGVAGMVYLAGVIRWGVTGAQLTPLDRLERQNAEIIDLLEIVADKGTNGADLDLIRRLRLSGQLSEQEYRKQRKELLRRHGDVD